jgi:hypothetical protein
MKKSCLITTIVVVNLIVAFAFYSYKALVWDVEPTKITGHTFGVKGSIEFYYLNGSLSVSCIQVRRIQNTNPGNLNGIITYEKQEEYVLENYEHYDNLVGYCLSGDTLTIFLKKGYWLDKQSSNFVSCDTFQLNINDVKYKIK